MKGGHVSIRGLMCAVWRKCVISFFDFLIQLTFLTLVRHCMAKAQDADGNFMPNGCSQEVICNIKTGGKKGGGSGNRIGYTLYSGWTASRITLHTII